MKRVLVPALVLCAAIAGCGSGDDPAPATTPQGSGATTTATSTAATGTTATPTTTAGSPAPRIDRAADEATARRASLRLSDLPSGWVQKNDGSDDDGDSDSPCAASALSKRTRTARADMPDFEKGTPEAGGAVLAFPTDEAAQRYVDVTTGAETRKCVADGLRRTLVQRTARSRGVTIGAVSTSTLPPPSIGDGGRIVVIRVPATQNGAPATLEYAVAATRVGRFVSGVITYAVDAGVRDSVVEAAARRLRSALAEE